MGTVPKKTASKGGFVYGSRRASRFAPLPAYARNKNGRVNTMPSLFMAPDRRHELRTL